MHRLTGHSGRASVHMSEMSKQSTVPEYLPYVEPFFDLSTLAERLRHDDSVMPEYPVKDGNWHLARFIVQTRGENGEAEQVLFAMRLYSEEKRREKDLMSAADAARRANEAKSEFLSCMSHDIRTLMNVIMGFTNIALQHADDPGKMKECLEKIQISGGNLQELIDDVLDISRIESGEFKIVSQPVKLPELFDFYCQAIAGMAEAKHIPIIALTANAYHEDIQKCLAAGMNAHLSKPINIDRAVRTIIECARTAKENGQKKKAHESIAFVSLFAIFTACRRQISKFDSHRSGCASRR